MDEYDLVARQLAGIDAWHVRQRTVARTREVSQRSREQRLDLSRRMDVVREQQKAIIGSTQRHLEAGHAALCSARPRAVVAHRNGWFTSKVVISLREAGVEVIAQTDNGAEAVGLVVAEQPELLLVEDALAMLPGVAVVREVRECAPLTAVAAQVAAESGIGEMLEAGARAAYARRVPPLDVAQGLVALLSPAGA